ncbi:hypothetical protein [Streptomyces sp. NBC_01205]|uniref:hypothetical protein n=1 Tax=Streptomyces sp. NBC_01205 TaxID=2903771 RepID=UPI002E126D4B|nr:hypothetical protein OG573_01005 [Streptomyces sp. NBC_01205]
MNGNAKTPRLVSGASQEVSAAGGSTAATVPQQLRRRREAAYRCPPLPCGHRDPLDCAASAAGPSTYGLTESELRAHANQLIRWGWSLDEVLTRLAVQPRTAAPVQCLHLGVAA